MLVNSQTLQTMSTGFNVVFNKGFEGAKTVYQDIVMMTKSGGSEEVYGWLGQLPEIREWLGDRRIRGLETHGFKIKNRKFESTISIKRTDMEDDKIGILSPLFEDMGRRTAEHPEKLLAELIGNGFTSPCYDGQNFFDTDHPVSDDAGEEQSMSNFQAGASPAWYLLDLSRAVRPFIYQERMPFEMQRMDHSNDEHVFKNDEFLYGVRGRCNVGYGLWQMAYASKAELNADNYEAARTSMAKLRGNNGRLLGVRGTHLFVPTELEGKGRKLLKNMLGEAGESNSWFESAELMVSPWIS
ncbi:Mu-like prophage major head subunit gpT family protein [Parasphingorhabdus sp.]|uniref:Mu-like prophage major head subunit gpT family protein n=1 Tax=Parasphingorhabdus sp. TaxID=2709688 RepID=UPI003A8F7947